MINTFVAPVESFLSPVQDPFFLKSTEDEEINPKSNIHSLIKTNIHPLIKTNNHSDLKKILKTDIDLELRDPDSFNTPLETAIIHKSRECFGLLIQAKANVNAYDGWNISSTPLIHACARGDLEMVKSLVKYKANVNLMSPRGYYPLHAAFASPDILKFLISKGAGANEHGTIGLIFASTTSTDPTYTPLHFAAQAAMVKSVGYLIEVNSEQKSHRGGIDQKTPLELAEERRNSLISEYPNEKAKRRRYNKVINILSDAPPRIKISPKEFQK